MLSKTSVAWLTVRASPPVPTTGADSMSSSALMRATRPSAWAAAPITRPDCTAVSVVSPRTLAGASIGTLESFAARSKSAEAEMMRPGEMVPPR